MAHLRIIPGWLAGQLIFSTFGSALGADWPQWHGPQRDNLSTETGLLKQWPADGPALAWKATGVGAGYSSVSIAGGKIFTMGEGPDSSFVYALGEKSGTLVWSAKVGRPGAPGGYPGPRCTPTVAGGQVIALGQYGDLVALDAATGKEQWRKNLEKDFSGRMMSGWGYSESPLVDGDLVVCTPGGSKGTVVALDRKTGDVRWRSKEFTDNAAYASIIVAEFGGARQYLQLTDKSVAGIGASNGQLLWRAARQGRTAVVPTPIFHDQCVFVTSGYNVGCHLFKVTAAGHDFKTEQVYDNKNMVNHHGGVVLVGKHLYGHSDSKGWICQDFKTGDLVWSDRSVGKGALTFADGHLYLRSEGSKGTLALVEATPAGYKENGRFDQPDRSGKQSWPHPVVANGKLYLRDQDVLFCYDVKAR